jgi:hypothetical protein
MFRLSINADVKLFLVITIGLVLILFIPSVGLLAYAKLLLGLFFYVLLVGYIFLDTIFGLSFEEALLMASIAGLGIQNFFILILYNVVAPYFLESINLGLSILLFNICFLTVILALKLVRNNYSNNLEKFPISRITRLLREPIMFVFLLGLAIRLFYQTFNTSSLMSDAALYCDTAKQLVTQGRFTSNVLNDGSTNPYQLQNGLIMYPFTWFLISLFFFFGEPTLVFAKLYAVFMGAILVFPTYLLTKKLFTKRVALIASLIVATHPLLNFYSTVLYGPEITSLLFSVSMLYFLTSMSENNGTKYAILAGVFAAMAIFSWRWEMFFVYIGSFAIFLAFNRSIKEVLLWLFLASLAFAFLGFTVFLYPILLTLIAGLAYAALLSLKRSQKGREIPLMFCMLAFFAVIGLVAQLTQNRSYMLPELIIHVSHEPTIVEARIMSMLFPNLQVFPELLIKYFCFASDYATYPLLLFAFLSIVCVSDLKKIFFLWSFILLSAVTSALMILPVMFEGTGFSFSRLFIAPTWFLSILATVFIHYFGNLAHLEGRTLKVRIKFLILDRFHLNLKVKVATFASILTAIVLIPSFCYGYVAGVNIGMEQSNFLKYSSIEEAMSWISRNTDLQSVILSLDPRLTAWFSTRRSAGLLVRNGTKWTADIGLNDLLHLSRDFRARYLFLSPSTIAMTSSNFLRQLYKDSPSSVLLREFNKDLLLNSSIQPLELSVLSQAFKSYSTPYSIIYELKDYHLTTRFLWLDDQFDKGWRVARGSASVDNGTISLVTNETEDWGMYIFYAFSNETLEIDNSTYVIINVLEISEKSTAGIYLRFIDGTEYTQYFSKPGFYMIDLGKFAGKRLSSVYLYNLLVLKKNIGISVVQYEFLAFASLTMFSD